MKKTTFYQFSSLALSLLILFTFVEMAGLGYLKYAGYNVSYFDLGAMSQAVWSATQGEPLIFTGQGLPLSRLARNVEIFYFFLAPLYALFPTPLTLIFAQAALYALGAIPLYRWAKRRLENSRFALIMAAIYLFYPAGQTAVLFEVHGDAFAMPLLLFALDALDRSAWRSYGFWLVLALSSKFYVAAPVAVLGLILLYQGRRRVGLATLAVGVSWGIVTFFGIFLYFAPPGPEAEAARATISSYISSRFVGLDLANTAVLRFVNAVIVLMPAVLVLGWRAPLWLLPALAITVPALFSVGFGPSFSYRTHHYAVAVPFLVAAVLEAARQQKESPQSSSAGRPAWQGRLVLTLFVVLTFNLVFVETPFSPFSRLIQLGPRSYEVTQRDAFKDGWLAKHVPPDAPLAASGLLAPRLVNRHILYLTLRPVISPLSQTIDQVDYVVTDALNDQAIGDPETAVVFAGGIDYEHQIIRDLLVDPRFSLISAQDGLVLFGRTANGLVQEVSVETVADPPPLQEVFNDQIGLVGAKVMEVERGSFQLEVIWFALHTEHERPFVAITQLQGVPHSRIVHLPTLALKPTTTWQANELIVETITFTPPEGLEPGNYPLLLSWHDTQNLFASETDARSRIGEQVEIGTLIIE